MEPVKGGNRKDRSVKTAVKKTGVCTFYVSDPVFFESVLMNQSQFGAGINLPQQSG